MGNVAKLFPYRDTNGRLMFRGKIGVESKVSKFFPVRVDGRMLLRGKGADGKILWGFPYREAATGRLMGRTLGAVVCSGSSGVPLTIDVSGTAFDVTREHIYFFNSDCTSETGRKSTRIYFNPGHGAITRTDHGTYAVFSCSDWIVRHDISCSGTCGLLALTLRTDAYLACDITAYCSAGKVYWSWSFGDYMCSTSRDAFAWGCSGNSDYLSGLLTTDATFGLGINETGCTAATSIYANQTVVSKGWSIAW
jgi:hypothetical protein